MIKIVIPKNFEVVAPYFKEPEHKRSLYLTAMDGEELLAVARFMVKGETAELYDIINIMPEVPMAVLDGLIRTTLFQAADLGCEACRVYNVPEALKAYFEGHQFNDCGEYISHDAYVYEFFKPCPGCAGAVD